MGFFDLFKPKWKHPNWKVRIAAVEKLTNQKLLAEIAKNDKDNAVREAAVYKLTDQALLADLAKNSEYIDVRNATLNKLNELKKIKKK